MTIQLTNRPMPKPFTTDTGDRWCTIRSVGYTWPFDRVRFDHYQPVLISCIGSLWWLTSTGESISRPHWGL